jgi:hypothetical protein
VRHLSLGSPCQGRWRQAAEHRHGDLCRLPHRGTSPVTEAVIAWGTAAKPLGGPHGSNGTSYSGNCSERACHAKSPHGVGGSQYGLFNAKLLNAGVDSAVAAAAANPASSGVTAALLTGAGQNMNFTGAADAVRVGYTCNQADCHVQTALAIVQAGWGEYRYNNYPLDASGKKMKTGHLSVSAIGNTAYTAASSCAGCHDQVDSATRSGYTSRTPSVPRLTVPVDRPSSGTTLLATPLIPSSPCLTRTRSPSTVHASSATARRFRV